MDANKLRVLETLSYRILPTCSLCVHASIAATQQWGVCNIHVYKHEKHSGEPRKLSINSSGTCTSFKTDQAKIDALEGFRCLFES